MKSKPKKCEFCLPSIRYLGHVISAEGVMPDPSVEPPTDKSQLRSFLGLSTYYRRYIRDFATVALPLMGLLKENTSFQ